MALNFSKASTQFVRNLVELGVCDNPDCLNAYHAPAGGNHVSGSLPSGRASLPSSLRPGVTPLLQHSRLAAPSTRPVIPVEPQVLVDALGSDDFPLAAVARQLSSAELQLSQSLARFVDTLFTSASKRYGLRFETLVRALRLLEQVQLMNIRAHQRHLHSQPSTLSSSGSDIRSVKSRSPQVPALGPAALPPSCASTCPPAPASAPVRIRHRSATRSALSPAPSPVVRPSASVVPLPASGQGWLHRAVPHPSYRADSLLDGSSVSSDTVGPLTDVDGLPPRKADAGRPSSLLTSWCLPSPASPSGLPGGCGDTATTGVDLPALLRQLHVCTACAGTRVFALQYFNVHLFLAACLVLSISINEVALMETMLEDQLVHEVTEMSQCADLPLHVAVRTVCETLEGQLCVFDSDVDVLLHRLNVVESCVFATEDL